MKLKLTCSMMQLIFPVLVFYSSFRKGGGKPSAPIRRTTRPNCTKESPPAESDGTV
jgi:hypothetical protein